MPFDREDTLKKAEKLLRQGRLDGAIAEYLRVVEDQPRDWNTANTLGDLYVRGGQAEKAVAQYARVAEHLFTEGFYPKAAALYKKILKIAPDDETAQLHLADLSARQGLLVDAKSYLIAVGNRRRTRGDKRGAAEIVVRLGSLDPADVDARLSAARVVEESGDVEGAAARYRQLYDDLLEKGKEPEALDALRQAVRLNGADRQGRALLARTAVANGDLETARSYLDREAAGDDPALLIALVDIELRSGQLEAARELLPPLLATNRDLRHNIVELAWTLGGTNPEAAFVCVDAAVDASLTASDFEGAAGILQEFVTRVPGQIPALLKLVEVCVDGGLEATMYETQAQLTDAYLSVGQAAEARVIAEDLVAREPWEQAHIERFRRALVMLRVPEPDAVIAERLSGHSPFVATDPFSDGTPPDTQLTDADAPAGAAVVETQPEAPPSPPVEEPPLREEVPPPEAPPARPRATVEIDLTSALGELEGASAAPVPNAPAPRESLDEVFQDFRNEVSREGSADRSAQHLTLGRTYLEMGMLDEAVKSLKTAARSPRQRFEAGVLLGRLYIGSGDMAHAIEWLERAAQVPAPTAEEGRALLYDLGSMLEAAGESARALAVFLELQADDGEYRDVSARAERLARVQAGS